MLGSLQLLKDVLLGELSCVWNASVRLRIWIDCCSVLSLDIEQNLLGPGTESELTLLLEVYFLSLPVSAVAVKNDVAKVVPELQSLSPLGELPRLSILVVVGPVVCYWRVVPSTVLERVGLAECVFDIGLLAVCLGCLILSEISIELRSNRILTSGTTLSGRSGRPLWSRRSSGTGRTIISL